MGQGSYKEAEATLINTEFWLMYRDFEARWEELEREDSEYSDKDD